jgi:hypothetical protein
MAVCIATSCVTTRSDSAYGACYVEAGGSSPDIDSVLAALLATRTGGGASSAGALLPQLQEMVQVLISFAGQVAGASWAA